MKKGLATLITVVTLHNAMNKRTKTTTKQMETIINQGRGVAMFVGC